MDSCLSLGVDLVPYKVCYFDCIYCQLGRTTRKTLSRLIGVLMNEGLIDAIRRDGDDGLTCFGHAHDYGQELIPCQDRPNSDA